MDALENLSEELRSTLENLKPAAPQDFGLTVENKKKEQRSKKENLNQQNGRISKNERS